MNALAPARLVAEHPHEARGACSCIDNEAVDARARKRSYLTHGHRHAAHFNERLGHNLRERTQARTCART